MKRSTPNFTSLAAAAVLLAAIAPTFAQTTATTDPVGFFSISVRGGSDNVIALPMSQAYAFAGIVESATATTLTVSSGGASPAWTTNQYVYSSPSQRQTYLVEFQSGALKGLYYKVTANTANTLTLDTEGDSLISHAPLGSVAANDAIRIRPYWRIRDIFESSGTPIIEARTGLGAKDDILIPNYVGIGINKAPAVQIYYKSGTGWLEQNSGTTDFSDFILRPNEAIIVRRRNAAPLTITTVGAVPMIRAISFIPGGNGSSDNDTYISLNHPAPISLDDSGLRSADQANSVIKDSTSDLSPGDRLLAFNPNATGINQAAPAVYYYRQGQGWKQQNVTGVIGSSVFLQPGVAYIVRKKAANAGADWVNVPSYSGN